MYKNKVNLQDRRDFLKKSTLGVGAVAASSSITSIALSPKAQAANSKTIVSAARWGAMAVVVEDGKLVKSGPAFVPAVTNELQSTAPELVHGKTRVKYPMVRKGFLENPGKSDTTKRGNDEWVRVSWDDALKLVHGELTRVRKEYGVEGVFAGSYGWRSTGVLHASRTLLHRYMNLTGGFVGTRGDYSTGAAQVIMPHVMGTIEVYEQQTSWEVVLENTEVVVLWSANPMTTLRIAWTSADQQGIGYFQKLKESGKKIICIDPVRSETCEFLNAQWVPVNTATDVPLMMGMAHTLLAKDKADKDFLKKYTSGSDKFIDYLMGKEDGVVKDSAWAAKICGIDAKTIEELALLFASKRTMLMGGWGMQRQQHGEQAHWMLVTLAAMIGQIGLPGGGFGLSYHYSNGGVPTATGGILGAISANSGTVSDNTGTSWLAKSTAYSFPLARIADALENPGKVIDFNGQKITYPNIKLIYWAGGNPFSHHQDVTNFVKMWQKPETIIVNEIFWTPTARLADIVLPTTTSYERNDLTMTGDYSNLNIVPMLKAVEPQFEAKSDYDIFAELSKLAGVEKDFTEGKSEMDWLRTFYDVAYKSARANRVIMPKFDKFWKDNKPLTFKVKPKDAKFVRYASFREDPLLNPLGTPSGKIEIYSSTIEKMGYADCKAHPTWMEPLEYAGNTTAEAPLALVTPHPYYRLHSQQANTSLRKKYAVSDREPILIHPEDAKARGIVDGDIVKAYNKRGAILAGAVVTDGIIKGTVAVHEGAWYDPLDPTSPDSICKNGCANVLTMDIGTSNLAQGNSPNTTILQIEKYTEAAPAITVFTEPKYKA